MEAFSRKRPNVSHFRIFGSLVYFHVTKDAWKKIDPTTKLGILVGNTDTPDNYHVFLPTSLKFDEQKTMQVSLERELKLHVEEEISVPKEEELHTDANQLHA